MALDDRSKEDLKKIITYSKKPNANRRVIDLAFKRLSAVVNARSKKRST